MSSLQASVPSSQKVLSVIESLGKGSLGFLCGVVHAQVFGVVQAGVASRLHIVDHGKQATWTVVIDSQDENAYNNYSSSSVYNSINLESSSTTSQYQKQSRSWCNFDKGQPGLAVTTGRIIHFSKQAVLTNNI